MIRYLGYLQIGLAILLYLLGAVTFVDYMYSLTIRDTVTAVENAFGTLVILIFLLVLAKFTLAAGRKKLALENASSGAENGKNSGADGGIDPGQPGAEEETEK